LKLYYWVAWCEIVSRDNPTNVVVTPDFDVVVGLCVKKKDKVDL